MICRGLCAVVCLPITHAVNKLRTVLFADPRGARMSRFGPAMSNKYLLLSPVISSWCHSSMCLAGGLSKTVQKVKKSSCALLNTESVPEESSFSTARCAFKRKLRLYANVSLLGTI